MAVRIEQGGTGTGAVTADAVVGVVLEALGCEPDRACVLEGIRAGNGSIPRWVRAGRFRRDEKQCQDLSAEKKHGTDEATRRRKRMPL
jgi:hypothetical protein